MVDDLGFFLRAWCMRLLLPCGGLWVRRSVDHVEWWGGVPSHRERRGKLCGKGRSEPVQAVVLSPAQQELHSRPPVLFKIRALWMHR